MAFLLALAAAALPGWAAYATVRALARSHASPRWWAALALLLAAGTAAGTWCGFFCEYPASDRLRVFSCPVPAAFFHLENGQWVDFVTPAPCLVASLNLATVALAAVLPLSVVYVLRRRTGQGRVDPWPGR